MRPAMTRLERQEILQSFAAAFGSPRQVLATIGRIKSTMVKWVKEARERIRRKRAAEQKQEVEMAAQHESTPQASSEAAAPEDAVIDPDDGAAETAASMPLFINRRATIGNDGCMPADAFEGTVVQQETASALASSATRNEHVDAGSTLLEQRLTFLGLKQIRMSADDGNSQFRAIALQIYGDAEAHHHVRVAVVQEMRKTKETDYAFLFESATECDEYLNLMEQDGTLGDELTLRAACDCFGIILHVLTSDPGESYYLKYVPNMSLADDACEELLDVFVGLVLPVHFNAILRHAAD